MIMTNIKAIFASKFAKFVGHTFLIIATLHFWAEMNDPYGDVEEHIKIANMGWIISVCIFYLDKLIMSVYEIQKVNLLCIKAYEKIKGEYMRRGS
jgi:hypothetical protein